MKLRFAILVFFSCVLFLGCGTNSNQDREVDSFDLFYEKFHSDTAFQLSRVVFPLPGINTEDMSILDSVYFWEEENWEFHNKPQIDDSSEFGIEVERTDSLVVEVIFSKDPGLVVRRQFKKVNGEWYLINYESVF